MNIEHKTFLNVDNEMFFGHDHKAVLINEHGKFFD